MSLHAIGLAIWIGAALAWVYGAYHYWCFINKLEEARMAGKIPASLQRQRMGIVWMIASPGLVPGGDIHRRHSMYAIAAFAGFFIAFAFLGQIAGHLTN
jgi:hypothetical protein